MIEKTPARNATGTSAIEARQLAVEPALELRIERSGPIRVRGRVGRLRTAPAPYEHRDHRGGAEQPDERQKPGEPVEALARRRGEHARPELRDELDLALLLRAAGRHAASQERLDSARDGRLRRGTGRLGG